MTFKILSTCAMLLVSSQSYAGSEKEWKELGLLCQNVGYDYCQLGGPQVGLIPEWHEKERARISSLLDVLVERGELQKSKLRLRAPKEWSRAQDVGFDTLFEKLGKTYGKFVVAEMMSIGFERSLGNSEDVIELDVRLPAKELALLKKTLAELGVFEK